MKPGSVAEFTQAYLGGLSLALKSISPSQLRVFVDWLKDVRNNKGTVWIAGNGGSGSTSDHFAVDLLKLAGVKAIALPDNQATVLALGNDVGYEEIFNQQLGVLAEAGDVVVLISGSGNSPNVVKAAQGAKQKGCRVISLTGRDGGKLGPLADLHINIPVQHMGMIEDCHMTICHIVSYYLCQ
jgi:D-sedoheptulose 7-phosphate isomerase